MTISDELKVLLGDIEVNTKYLFTEKDRITSKKSRIIASQQQVVRYDRESTDEININHKSLLLILLKRSLLTMTLYYFQTMAKAFSPIN